MAIEPLFPRWAQSIDAILGSNALARSQCRACGIQQRVDLEALAAKLGGAASLIGRTDRCSVVACDGSVFYMAARTYGRQWITLGGFNADGDGAAPRNAQSFAMVDNIEADSRS